MGETIHIDDLSDPRLTEAQAGVVAATPEPALTLDAVLDAARDATGLTDFGAEDFRDRLRVWLQSVREDEGLSALGRAGMFGDCVRYAATRLRFEDLWRNAPRIADIVIDRPIMVAGLPRSGTTHLVNMLSEDPRLRSVPLWESMEPMPVPGEPADARRARCEAMWGGFEALLPLMPAMHEMAPDHTHEDIDLHGVDFSSYLPEWLCRAKSWRDYYADADQTPHYRYAKRMLQALTHLKGPNRWVVKSPPHMENLPALFAVHPDAIVPITHRDPVAVLQSAVTMIAYGDRIRRTKIDPPALLEYWADRIEMLLRRCVRDRDAVPAGQTLDIYFHEYMADQERVVREVYAMAELPFRKDDEARLDAFLKANRRGAKGKVEYDLIGQFGADIDALRKRFAFYYDRFPVKLERVKGEA